MKGRPTKTIPILTVAAANNIAAAWLAIQQEAGCDVNQEMLRIAKAAEMIIPENFAQLKQRIMRWVNAEREPNQNARRIMHAEVNHYLLEKLGVNTRKKYAKKIIELGV